MTSSTIDHPSLGERRGEPAWALRQRRAILPGVATGTFWVLAAVVTVLNMVGLIMVLSASSVVSVRQGAPAWSLFERQVVWTLIGMVALAVCLTVSLELWRRHARLWLAASVGLLVLVLVPGVGQSANGATRWIALGPVQLQPSEFAKFGLLLFVADLLDRRAAQVRQWRRALRPAVISLGVVAALVMAQPNLGTTIIIAATIIIVLFVAGAPLGGLSLVTLAGAAVAAASVAYTPFRRARFLRFLNPWADPTNTGLQNIQSLVGLANGGLFGRGLGRSTAKWGFLPFAHTDFIFAVIGEELGLVGALMVVALFFGLALLGTAIAMAARDQFSRLVATGITAWLTVQAFMNVGAVIGIMPITGVPLPFISSGGSSLIVNLAAVGMLLNIARHPADAAARRISP